MSGPSWSFRAKGTSSLVPIKAVSAHAKSPSPSPQLLRMHTSAWPPLAGHRSGAVPWLSSITTTGITSDMPGTACLQLHLLSQRIYAVLPAHVHLVLVDGARDAREQHVVTQWKHNVEMLRNTTSRPSQSQMARALYHLKVQIMEQPRTCMLGMLRHALEHLRSELILLRQLDRIFVREVRLMPIIEYMRAHSNALQLLTIESDDNTDKWLAFDSDGHFDPWPDDKFPPPDNPTHHLNVTRVLGFVGDHTLLIKRHHLENTLLPTVGRLVAEYEGGRSLGPVGNRWTHQRRGTLPTCYLELWWNEAFAQMTMREAYRRNYFVYGSGHQSHRYGAHLELHGVPPDAPTWGMAEGWESEMRTIARQHRIILENRENTAAFLHVRRSQRVVPDGAQRVDQLYDF